jgi:predicted transport protein
MFQEVRSIFWNVIISVKKVYMYMCPNPNGFRDRAILPYSSKIVDKKEILRTVSNTGIYCSGDKVGTVYLV